MKRVVVVILLLVIVAGAFYIFGKGGLNISFNKPSPVPTLTPSPSPLAGSDRDVHGCIGSAGYSWCESKQTCLRPWEETCPASTPIANENDAIIKAVKAGLIAEHGQDAANMTVTISTVEADYAKGMASEQGGGGIWFAAKVSGTWKLVWDGNGTIMCSDLTSYPNFPKDLIPNCWDTATNKLLTR